MGDFINKIITIILIFAMLVLAPILLSYKTDDMVNKRLVLNDVELFLDKVADVQKVTQEDANQLYMNCNSHGISVDVTIKVMMKTAVPQEDDRAEIVYYAITDINDMEFIRPGDVVQVAVTEIGISATRRLEYNILKMDNGRFEFTLAKAAG